MSEGDSMQENGISPDTGSEEPPKKAPAKKLTVEKIYQKKSQLEHILLRPDTYIGSVEPVTETMWVYDAELEAMSQKEITYVPGLYKIFDEILVNAADNKQRDPKMDCIKITIDAEANTVSVWNNGKGIPVVEHKDEKMFVPTMIFGHLLTSSNYNDEEEKVTGGRNGFGAKLCNIFSTKFTVETSSSEYKRCFKQTWGNNMAKASEPKIKPCTKDDDDYTKITFSPDLTKFKMDRLDDGIVSLMSRRAYDVAASTRGVKVFLNGKRLPIKTFKDYVELYIKGKEDETGNPYKVIYENVNDRWEVAVTISDRGFQQVSFVNSIATTKGGRHVDHVADMIVKQLIDTIKKKNKGGLTVKPFQVKNHMWIFVNCLIVNPTFDSQTKETMTLQAKSFGSKCNLPEKFINSVSKSGIIENVLSWAKFKAQTQLQKTCSGKKQNKLKGVPKLEDANDAGTKNSLDCTLILTEGDSAKSLAVSGLGVVGRDKYGVFPLRGKLLNVREATHKQILENAEINNIIKIVGLQYKKKYETMDDLRTLRYGRLMIMTDQDQDGSHIKGLIINFIHTNWPSLLKLPFLEEFITPIIKASKGKEEISFYSLPEFEEWKKEKDNWHTYKIKYYKGLGTSTSKEAKEYFSDMKRHRILFKHGGDEDDKHILMAFSKKLVDSRKEWLTNWMTDCKRRAELGLPEDYLYTKTTRVVSYKDFINKELVLFSNMDNERSIPSLVDGLKPGSRKVLFTCLKRNDKREIKVAQLAGSVAEHSAYHHGEMSLMSTIINLAQNYVGSNNLNLLQPIGQFGTRLQGGKDAASPRYIFTMMSPLTRLIFHPHDDPLLKYLKDDNQKIEPVWYIPIIPMILVNGASGIGTGWMTKIPNYNPREIIQVLKRMMEGEEAHNLKPWYKNFRGDIEQFGMDSYMCSGELSVMGPDKLEITELPIGTWTQAYKEAVMEVMLHGDTDKKPAVISDYKEYHTDTTVRFVVTLSADKLLKLEEEGLHKAFKLQSSMSISCMCAFDKDNVLKKYENIKTILTEFYEVRLEYYEKRKAYLEGMLQAEAAKLSNQARFIVEKCDGILTIENKKKKAMIEELVKKGYDSDPVKAWKLKQDREAVLEEQGDDSQEEVEEEESTKGPDYDYLLGMTMWSLTKEKKDELLRKRDEKQTELRILQAKTPKIIWNEDLDNLLEKMDEVETQERLEEAAGSSQTGGKKPLKLKPGATMSKKAQQLAAETMPSPKGRRVEPKIPEETKKKLEKAIQAKENKGKRTKKIKEEPDDKDEFDMIAEDQKSLVDKLGYSPEKGMKKAKGVKKEPKQSKPKTKGSPKKKGRNPWSDSEDDGSFSSGSDFDQSPPEKSTPVRTTARRSAAANIKFNFDENSSSDEEMELKDNEAVLNGDDIKQEIDDDLDDGDFHSENNVPSDSEDEKPKKKAGGGRKKKPGSDGESEPKKPKKAPAKPKPKKKKGSDSDSEDDFAPKKTKSKAAPKAKKVTSTATSENDSDSDFGMKQPPSRAVEEDRDALFDSLLMSEPVKKTTVDTYSTEPDSPVKKSKPAPKPKKAETAKPKKAATKRPKKAAGSDSDDMFGEEPKKKAKKRRKLQTQTVKTTSSSAPVTRRPKPLLDRRQGGRENR
ncbi:DNA topoisomerase 2-like isoform X2 [Homalodisca vitripennis]|uniref:DNA topoisomerase 2-like isoform X2 n=1 Tax=Homalodisca vitripennis TaxID=197043 RepID=UPI001EEB7574|nr:DNA topoisomerase 2-like isoform X2 [Homalodisca vitripennis]